MQLVLIVVLLFVTLALIGIILIQKSEGGTSGLTGGGGMGGMMSARSAKNFLTRTTSILAAIFMGLCLVLAIIASRSRTEAPSILDNAPVSSVASSTAETPS
jgi:preprotein translocase subunit SecG